MGRGWRRGWTSGSGCSTRWSSLPASIPFASRRRCASSSRASSGVRPRTATASHPGAARVPADAEAGGGPVTGEVHVLARGDPLVVLAPGLRSPAPTPGPASARQHHEVPERWATLEAVVSLRIDPPAAREHLTDELLESHHVDGMELAPVDEDP